MYPPRRILSQVIKTLTRCLQPYQQPFKPKGISFSSLRGKSVRAVTSRCVKNRRTELCETIKRIKFISSSRHLQTHCVKRENTSPYYAPCTQRYLAFASQWFVHCTHLPPRKPPRKSPRKPPLAKPGVKSPRPPRKAWGWPRCGWYLAKLHLIVLPSIVCTAHELTFANCCGPQTTVEASNGM